MVFLEVKNLTYSTPTGKALQSNLSFLISSGEAFVIRGPNGAGKSTLLRILRQENYPFQGELKWNIPAQQVAYVPQLENTLIHWPITLGELLRLSMPRATDQPILGTNLLEPKHLSMPWNSASGGERKRTLLAKALLTKARLLILDEPMNHLDGKSRDLLMHAFETFLDDRERGILLVSHAPLSSSVPARVLDLVGVEA